MIFKKKLTRRGVDYETKSSFSSQKKLYIELCVEDIPSVNHLNIKKTVKNAFPETKKQRKEPAS